MCGHLIVCVVFHRNDWFPLPPFLTQFVKGHVSYVYITWRHDYGRFIQMVIGAPLSWESQQWEMVAVSIYSFWARVFDCVYMCYVFYLLDEKRVENDSSPYVVAVFHTVHTGNCAVGDVLVRASAIQNANMCWLKNSAVPLANIVI